MVDDFGFKTPAPTPSPMPDDSYYDDLYRMRQPFSVTPPAPDPVDLYKDRRPYPFNDSADPYAAAPEAFDWMSD